MKSKELIRLLKEEDPSGEIEVNIDGSDIFSVENLPAYYDGSLKVLIHDESKKPYFDVVGVEFRRNGRKIRLHSYDWQMFLWDNIITPLRKDLHVDIDKWADEVQSKLKFDHEPGDWFKKSIEKEISEIKKFVKEQLNEEKSSVGS